MAHEPKPLPEPELPPEEEKGRSRRLTTSELTGKTLGDRYRFEELLGEGTFARVFRVHDLYRRVDLAAKVLRSDIAHEPAFLERFRREAMVLSRLQHPNIVRYYDTVEMDGVVFILTDYIPGETLQQLLHDLNKPVSPLESLSYLTPLAAALHYAHREGVVHRDLKPANILLDENKHLYITDFGIARILTDTSTLTVDTTVGTPHYMSPEQILAGKVTAATDIYALGVMLYQMYTGRLPFTGESEDTAGTTTAVRIVYEHLHVKPRPLSEINPRISKAVEDVVLRCLEKDPEQRYASVSEVYDALTDAIGTPSVSLDAQSLAEAVRSPAPEKPARSYDRVDARTVPDYVPDYPVDEDSYEKPKRKRKSDSRREMHDYRAEVRLERKGEKQREKERDSDEKEQEKENEKEGEKEQEKGEFWGDVAPSDRLAQLTWGGIVSWAGIVLLLNSVSGIFNNPWSWVLTGAGSLLLVEVGVRLFVPAYRSNPGARLILGVVLLMLGLGIGFSIGTLWPLILIMIGVSILINHLVDK